MLKKSWKYALALVCASALACNSGKAPAEAAMKLAEEAVNGARAEAEKLVPDDFKSLSDDLNVAKDQLAKGDYKAVLASAPAIQQKANDVAAKAMAKKEELTKTWNDLAGDVPKAIEAVKSRVGILAQSKRLPAGITQQALDTAKAGLASASQTWSEATAAASAGDVATAVAKGTAVKASIVNIMQSLNMQVPAGAGS